MRDRIWDWIDELDWRFGDGIRDILRKAKVAVRLLFKPATLSALATIISAGAAWLSYQTSLRSVELAEASQRSTTALYFQQLALAQPSLSISGGKVMRTWSGDADRGFKEVLGPMEVVVVNAGTRPARPVWVTVNAGYRIYRASVSEIPANGAVAVALKGTYGKSSEPWRVSLVYGDDVPDTSKADQAQTLTRKCIGPRIMQLDPLEQTDPSSSIAVSFAAASPGVAPGMWPHLSGFQRQSSSDQEACSRLSP